MLKQVRKVDYRYSYRLSTDRDRVVSRGAVFCNAMFFQGAETVSYNEHRNSLVHYVSVYI